MLQTQETHNTLVINPLIDRIQIFNRYNVELVCCIALCKSVNNYKPNGGTRFAEYDTLSHAIEDAIKLAEAMTIKWAIAKLPYVGGKAVLLKPIKMHNSRNLFREYGKIIQSLGGDFITGCDVGVSNQDMKIAKHETDYITGLSYNKHTDHLSYLTALGVFESMKVCLKRTRKTNSFYGIHVVIQGIGKVGSYLAQILSDANAILTVCDKNMDSLQKISHLTNINVVKESNIFDIKCDIFSPCALGGIINHETINLIKCSIICGAANNQLSTLELLNSLEKRNILFIPDWICNIGGAIYASESYTNKALDKIIMKVKQIIVSRSNEFIGLLEKYSFPKAFNTFIDNLNISSR